MVEGVTNEFPSYLAFRANKDGKNIAFYIGPSIEKARNWINKDNKESTKQEQIKENSSESDIKKSISSESDLEGFSKIIDNSIKSIKSFYDLVAINYTVRSVFPGMFFEREVDEYRKNLKYIREENGCTLYGVPQDRLSQLNIKIKRYDHMREGVSSIPSSVMLSLVAKFDANVSGLVRFLLQRRKERLAGNDRTILIKEVLSASSFDDLVANLIDDEIHILMRGSHDDQVKYIEDNFSIKIKSGYKRWGEFIEIFERRNLVAHGEGFATARYVRICENAKIIEKNRLKIGERVSLGDAYLRSSIDILLEFIILTTWWIWLKHSPGSSQDAYTKIGNICYDLIVDKKYKLASRILESALSRQTQGALEVERRMMAVNLANCYKKTKDLQAFESAISMFEWSASADKYRISVAALNEDIEQVCLLMPKVSDENDVGKWGLREWPVFDWVRNNEKFGEKFTEIFNEPLEFISDDTSSGEVEARADERERSYIEIGSEHENSLK